MDPDIYDQEVQSILETWGFPAFIKERFSKNYIDLESFKNLDGNEMKELIGEVGLLKKFKKCHAELNAGVIVVNSSTIPRVDSIPPNAVIIENVESDLEIQEDASSPISNNKRQDREEKETERNKRARISSTPPPISPDLSMEDEDSNQAKNLYTILQKSIMGKMVWSLYSKKKAPCLEEKHRRILTDVVIQDLITENPSHKIDFSKFDTLSKEIVEIFPQEKKGVYYIPATKATLAMGKFPDKYHNLRRDLKKAGVIDSEGNQNQTNGSSKSKEPVPDTDEDSALLFLKECGNASWSLIEEKWVATSKIRTDKLRFSTAKDDDLLLAKYYTEYPCLRLRNGYQLLERDFEFLYPGKSLCLIRSWPDFSSKVWDVLKAKNRGIDDLDDLDEDDSNRTDVLLRFSEIFNPVFIRCAKGKKGWKPTRAEMQDGFVIHVKTVGEIPERIRRRKEKLALIKARRQPSAIVLGANSSEIISSFVEFDETRYEVESPLRAVDVCFKLYQALHAEYPPESKVMWTVLQRLVYGITTEWDEKSPSLLRALTDLGSDE